MKEIIAEGEYVMGEGETPEVAAEKAKKNAVRHAAEQAGAFVKSYTKVHNMTLKDDVVEVIANHAMKITILAEEDTKVGKRAYRYYTKIKAVVSDEEIQVNLKRIQEDRGLVEAHKKLQTEYNQQMKETEELKKKLAEATGNERKEVLAKIGSAEAIFKATLWYEKGQSLLFGKEQQAIDAFTKAIELNPKFSEAYLERAQKYLSLGGTESIKNRSTNAAGKTKMSKDECFNFYKNVSHYYEMAVTDLNMVIAIDPSLVDAYKKRASVYDSLENITVILYSIGCVNWTDWVQKYGDNYVSYGRKALEDYTQAIQLSPNDSDLYEQKASSYETKIYLDDSERYRLAAEEMSKAIDKTKNDQELAETHKLIKLKRYYMKRAFYYGLAGKKNLEAKDKETLKVINNDLVKLFRNKQGYKDWLSSLIPQHQYAALDDVSLLQWTERELAPKLGLNPEEQVTIRFQREQMEALEKKGTPPYIAKTIPGSGDINELNKKIAKHPENPRNYLERAAIIYPTAPPAELKEDNCYRYERKKEEIIEDYTTAIKLFTVKPEINGIKDKYSLAKAYAGRASEYNCKRHSVCEQCARLPEKAMADYTEAIKIVKNIQKRECAAVGASNTKDCENILEKEYDKYEEKICTALGAPPKKNCMEDLKKEATSNLATKAKIKDKINKCGAYCVTIFKEADRLYERKSFVENIVFNLPYWLRSRAELFEELRRYRQALEDYTELCNMNVSRSGGSSEDSCTAVQRLK